MIKKYFLVDKNMQVQLFQQNVYNLGENYLLPKSPIKITDTCIKYDTYIWL